MSDWIGTFQNRARHDCSKRGQHCIDTTRQGFPWAVYTWGDLSHGGKSAEGQNVNGGTHEGGHRPYGGT